MNERCVKERPILFSGEMVRAILAGRKTQTRRVVKPPKGIVSLYRPFPNEPQNVQGIDADGLIGWYPGPSCCPYGQPGDRLWVRETFQPLFADGVEGWSGADWKTGKGYAVRYVASDGATEYYDDAKEELTYRRKPGIHMPRWASRINLEITGVRVERLQDISHADAIAEGIDQVEGAPLRNERLTVPQHIYAHLWDKINGAGAWDKNPWVWVVEFRPA